MKIASFDPALQNWGISYFTYSPSGLCLKNTDIIRTKKDSSIPRNLDDLRRCQYIYSKLAKIKADIYVAELPLGSQSAVSMKSYGMVQGLLSMFSPLITVSPYDVKRVIGSRTTDKKEIIEFTRNLYPDKIPLQLSIAEHISDSIVACHAALNKLEKYYHEHVCSNDNY